MNNYPAELVTKIKVYYTQLYQAVGLPDVSEKVASRLNEEDLELMRVAELECLLNLNFGQGQKHLIVGAGTGGRAVVLHNKKCEVYGIEPNKTAHEIVQMKAALTGIPVYNFPKEKAESLSFQNDMFDFIHCISVIEHVDDVALSLREMIRVLKPGGYIYIHTPNYRFPYEGHYKIAFPSFLPKIFGYLYLRLKGRPIQFLRHIKYISEKSINKILYTQPVIWQRVYKQFPKGWAGNKPGAILFRFFARDLNIPPSQDILIRKIGDGGFRKNE